MDKLRNRHHRQLAFSFWVYFVNFLLPFGFCILNGYCLAVFAALGTASTAWLVFSGSFVKYADFFARN